MTLKLLCKLFKFTLRYNMCSIFAKETTNKSQIFNDSMFPFFLILICASLMRQAFIKAVNLFLSFNPCLLYVCTETPGPTFYSLFGFFSNYLLMLC